MVEGKKRLISVFKRNLAQPIIGLCVHFVYISSRPEYIHMLPLVRGGVMRYPNTMS